MAGEDDDVLAWRDIEDALTLPLLGCCTVTSDSSPYGPTAWTSHSRTAPSPPELSSVLPLRDQSTSKTGKPFLCPSRTVEGSPIDDAPSFLSPMVSDVDLVLLTFDERSNDHIRTAASSHPAATLRPSGGHMDADVMPTFGSIHGANFVDAAGPAPASASLDNTAVADEHSVASSTEGRSASATRIARSPPFPEDSSPDS
mmetsp:Transcript_20373/g.48977  ORF Transcript_20373/g.48977 Transcript_20373/m.48977 type:complete len:200 (-) Transcript_20373:2360-2959(-)